MAGGGSETKKKDPKRTPSILSPSPSSKNNKRVWEEEKKLAEERRTSLDNNNNNNNNTPPNKSSNKKIKIAEQEKPLNEEKRIICLTPKAQKTSETHNATSVPTSTMKRAEEFQATLPPQFPTLTKLMLKSHVSGGYWLGLPRTFCVPHLPKHDDTIVLEDENKKEWDTRYLADKNGLSAGWRGFSVAHDLRDEDVLVFQLVEPLRFKVYIVRAKCFTEVNGAMGLLNLDSHAEPISADQPKDNANYTDTPSQNYQEPISNDQERNMAKLGSCNEATPNRFGDENDEGIRLSDSLNFKKVRGFRNFSIHVDGLNLDSEIQSHLRKKYYELCCHQNMFLHEKLIAGLNNNLASGIILETINIADAIRGANYETGLKDLEKWDKTLKAFEDLGMVVGFLRARIRKLLNFVRDFKEILELTKKERAEKENKLRDLKVVVKDLNEYVDALELKNKDIGFVLKEIANDPW